MKKTLFESNNRKIKINSQNINGYFEMIFVGLDLTLFLSQNFFDKVLKMTKRNGVDFQNILDKLSVELVIRKLSDDEIISFITLEIDRKISRELFGKICYECSIGDFCEFFLRKYNLVLFSLSGKTCTIGNFSTIDKAKKSQAFKKEGGIGIIDFSTGRFVDFKRGSIDIDSNLEYSFKLQDFIGYTLDKIEQEIKVLHKNMFLLECFVTGISNDAFIIRDDSKYSLITKIRTESRKNAFNLISTMRIREDSNGNSICKLDIGKRKVQFIIEKHSFYLKSASIL